MGDITLTPGMINLIEITIALIIGMAVRDIANNFVQGFLFYLNRNFKPGHQVYIDGEKAVIISCGIRQTIFRIDNGRGQTWRYVYNDKIKNLKLEKVVEPKLGNTEIENRLAALEGKKK